ncbi:MAG: hypothetical protein DSZ26_02720 [Thermovibrio sp.]|nr:MAG: hypothetical protein DSZ26_02720 [Thermovibrio sp.]
MRKFALLIPVLLSSCGIGSLNPFKKEQPVYTPYTPKSESQTVKSGKRGIENVVFYMKRYFSPLKGEIVLNSYDGFIIDLGSKDGVSVGDRFISESGAVLKVKEVKKNYSIALPTLGNPLVGESVQKIIFNKIAYIDFTREKGRELYRKLKENVKNLNLAPYEEGEKLKRIYRLRYPSDFKRRVPVDKLTGYDAYLVVSREGVALYDTTKHLIKFFPWEGAPQTSILVAIGSDYTVVYDFKGHGTSLFAFSPEGQVESEIVSLKENSILLFKPTPYGVKLVKKFKNPFRGSYLFHTCPVQIKGEKLFIVDGFYQDSKSVSSGVFKFVNGKLEEVASSNFILSCFDTNGDGINDSIFGQNVSSESDKFFGRNVYRMKLENGKIKKGSKIKVPKGFQVTSAQMFKTGGKEYFAYYDLNYFFNVSDGEKVLWRSPIRIGASPNSIYWYEEDNLVSYYITPKPKPIDIDGDGNQEVLFSQNKNAVPGLLRNIYTFDGGRILLLYRSGNSFDWEEATNPIYKMGGIEEFDYLPDQDIFVAIFTKVNILTNPKSKLLFIKPKI